MSDIEVSYRALGRGAADHDDLAARVTAARQRMEAATLPSGALGKLPQSDEILAAFEQRRSEAIELAGELADSMRAIGDNLRATVEDYTLTDDAVAARFTAAL